MRADWDIGTRTEKGSWCWRKPLGVVANGYAAGTLHQLGRPDASRYLHDRSAIAHRIQCHPANEKRMNSKKSRLNVHFWIFARVFAALALAVFISVSDPLSDAASKDSPTACFFVVHDLKSIDVFNYGHAVVEFNATILRSANESDEWIPDGRAFRQYYAAGSIRSGYYYGELSADEFGFVLIAGLTAREDGAWWNGTEKQWIQSEPDLNFMGSRCD